jgi:hypothetical protein
MWIEDEKFNPNIIIYKNKKKKKSLQLGEPVRR